MSRREYGLLHTPLETALISFAVGLAAVLGTVAVLRFKAAAERQRRSEETHLRAIVEASSDWFWETDAQGRFTFSSSRILDMADIAPTALIGTTFRDLAEMTGSPGVWRRQIAAVEAREPLLDYIFDLPVHAAETRRLRMTAHPTIDDKGDFRGYRGTVNDITAEAEAEARAEQAHARLTATLDSIAQGFVLWDADDRLLLCNRRFREIFATQNVEVTEGLPFDTFLASALDAHAVGIEDEERAAWTQARLTRHREPGPPFEIELASGQWLLVHERKTVENMTVGLYTDITPLKLRENELMEARVRAEDAAKAKAAFLANVSHELRTPLNAIIGFSEAIKGELFGPIGNPHYLAYISDIYDSGQHLLDVINDILDMTKAEAGKIVLDEKAVDIAQVVESCLRMVRKMAERAAVPVALRVPPVMPALWVDEKRLRQILLNLLTNAIKFSETDKTVTLSVDFPADAEGGGCRIVVADEGIGMSENDVRKALEPFSQVDTALARRYEGTGLGLPLTKTMIELQGGAMTIASERGQGTRVTVTFPRDRVVPAVAEGRAGG